LRDQVMDLESKSPVVEDVPIDRQQSPQTDEAQMEEGAHDLERLALLLVDWVSNMDRFEQMTRERPGVIQMLKTQREHLKASIEGLRARAIEQDNGLESLKNLVFRKLDLISPPNPPEMVTREEAITLIVRDVMEELRYWLDNEFDAMYKDIRDNFDETAKMAHEILGPVLELLEVCLTCVRE